MVASIKFSHGNIFKAIPDARCVKGISDTANNLDNTESIKASLCFFFFDQTTGSLPTVWADLSLPVHVSVAVI